MTGATMTDRDPRQQLADVFEAILSGEMTAEDGLAVANTLGAFPKHDKVLGDAYHFLHHYYSDDDIRAKYASYAAEQRKALMVYVQLLREPLEAKGR
jgi:hypothetical protein